MKTVGLLQLGRPQVVIQFDVDNAYSQIFFSYPYNSSLQRFHIASRD